MKTLTKALGRIYMNKSIFSLLFFLMAMGLYAQEQRSGLSVGQGESLRPLAINPLLSRQYPETLDGVFSVQSPSEIRIPFLDDFSYVGPYPDSRFWTSRQAFVNHTFPFYPPTYGVATLDGLDEDGQIYSHAVAGSAYPADTLCSGPIRLDSVWSPEAQALKKEDSVYLSFFYQPGGGWGSSWASTRRGTAPGVSEQLILEFYNPVDSAWNKVWASSGITMEEFCPLRDSLQYGIEKRNYFRQVMVPVDQDNYFHKDFRFRFRNLSEFNTSVNTAGGQWHIDYVYLNKGRSLSEVRQPDVAFVSVGEQILKEYTQVPYRQFSTDMLIDRQRVVFTNLGEVSMLSGYKRELYDQDGNVLDVYPQSGTLDLELYPFYQGAYRTNPVMEGIDWVYRFENLSQEGNYFIRHILSSTSEEEIYQRNDTLNQKVTFGSCLAYDDGSPEAGWGLNYAGSSFAYRFHLYQADTLTAFHVFFNSSYGQQNQVPVSLCVWAGGNTDTVPGNLLCKVEGVEPEFLPGLNRFGVYALPQPLILPAGDFYIGFEQNTNTFLNIGFDQNSDLSGHLLYTYYDTYTQSWSWIPSMYSGALLMRPAFGQAGKVSNEQTSPVVEEESVMLEVIPNPVRNGSFSLKSDVEMETSGLWVELFDRMGRRMWRRNWSESYPVGSLPAGIYIVRVGNGSRIMGYARLAVVG